MRGLMGLRLSYKMTKDEALKMAINTLCNCGLQIGGPALVSPYIHETVYACKEALEQPKEKKYLYVINNWGSLYLSNSKELKLNEFLIGKIEVQDD